MTNEEAFNEALKYCQEKRWIPSKWAFEMPMRVAVMCTRLSQAFYFLNHTDYPKTYKDLKKIEKKMKRKREERDESNNV